MMPSEAARQIKETLPDRYDVREKAAITEWLMEDLTGLTRVDRLLREYALTSEQREKLNLYIQQLNRDTPVQYITGYTWFMGEKFRVNKHVLIPRPETEELVDWAIHYSRPGMVVTDIGTGSGCIPIIIKKKQPATVVYAADISREALEVAMKNATSLHTEINWLQLDILHSSAASLLPFSDIIISNPPYIPLQDQTSMEPHVTEHEPHLALFVPDEDALIFYRAILNAAKEMLRPGGQIFFETHHLLAEKVAALSGWPSEIRTDLFGKQRMIRFERPL